MDMFFQDDYDFTVEEAPTYTRRGSLTYEDIVKDLVLEETQYMRDLNMIIKVFRAPFVQLFPRSKVKPRQHSAVDCPIFGVFDQGYFSLLNTKFSIFCLC